MNEKNIFLTKLENQLFFAFLFLKTQKNSKKKLFIQKTFAKWLNKILLLKKSIFYEKERETTKSSR
jgi:hypothetical protein